tara:strand:- start:253 stop:447 length:195 start_codon:yes stop_codon:yes gene_type:complete
MTDEQITRLCVDLIVLPVSDETRAAAYKIRDRFETNGSLSLYYKSKLKTLRKNIDQFIGPWEDN